jgi:ribonuclease T1
VSSGRRISIALAGLVLLAAVGWLIRGAATGSPATTSTVAGAGSGLPVTSLSSLPAQAAQTYELILAGGPFPYPHNDGVVFANREHSLPNEPSSYYHEYTVPTPGSPDRGARRLITGVHHELYYTGDHYKTFVVVDPGK